MATRAAIAKDHLERLLRVGTCLAQCGYGAQVGQLAATARAFRGDAQLWGAHARHRGRRGRTCLMHAARAKDGLDRVKFLVLRGAAVDAADASGTTALIEASRRGRLRSVRFLLELPGAAVNAGLVNNGKTALMWACQNGHLKTARCLVERGGANVNAARNTNQTALMFASEFGHLEIVRCLVERAGTNLNAARAFSGITALMCASHKGHVEIVRLLLQRGADRRARDRAGRSARDHAATHPLVQALFRSR
jgi:ankyrin repeat protein